MEITPEFLFLSLSQATTHMQKQIATQLSQQANITLTRYMILSCISAHPSHANQQFIAQRTGLHKGSISRQLHHALEDGEVAMNRSLDDQRNLLVEITPKGSYLVEQGDKVAAQLLQQLRQEFSESEIDTFYKILQAIQSW